ncbi:hypothetical protein DAPPUDRAFT_213412 [Daphnia pulex]|uniref:BTB domain-containing protein n=1 Tax=Daphnia pulex TaxID=6669 RepID=E9GSM0_DAPPU|nr:hypothetical protein DAPPUDRAFT_213412 [Daphnia pulex]|eukprot:EFX77454.1 hypothetical protein DAPPUDRAFT_213412 [Daphnia pulex]
MSTIGDENEPREVEVTGVRARPGRFCIRLHWEEPTKFSAETTTSKTKVTYFHYHVDFQIENQMCQYMLGIVFRFWQTSKDILCAAQLSRIAHSEEEDDEPRPRAILAFINQNETSLQLEPWGLNQWRSHDFDGSFAYPDGKDITDITTLTWETTNPNEWKPLTCHLRIEFETFAVGEKNALKQLTELYVQQNQCDVQFNLQDDQHIGGHSHILVARSPVFAAMFQHEMKEKKTGQVSIQDIQPGIFKQLLHYVYSGRLSVPLTETTAQRLFEAADKYDIGDLKDECIDFLLDCIRVDNVINLMAWAHIHSVDELTEAALTFTSLHGKEISQLKDWANLMKNYPEVCLEASRRIIDRMVLSSER